MTKHINAAVAFSEAVKTRCQTDWAASLRAELSNGQEHKVLAERLKALAALHGDPKKIHFDFEGNSRKPGTQRHSYPLLGAWTHPDAAVLEPFRAAIEFDRGPVGTGRSHFKTCLMKAACHVLSGAYDASLLVFILRRPDEVPSYLSGDDPKYTSELLSMLSARGLVVAIVPPAISVARK